MFFASKDGIIKENKQEDIALTLFHNEKTRRKASSEQTESDTQFECKVAFHDNETSRLKKHLFKCKSGWISHM